MEAQHTKAAEARAAISAGMRRKWQERREQASLVVYSVDEALRLAEEAEASIVIGADAAKVEAKVALALEAMRSAADLVKRSP